VQAVRQRARRRLDGEMKVVRHQAVVVEDPAEALDGSGEEIEKEEKVRLVAIDRNPVIATRHDVMERSWNLEPERPLHTAEGASAFNL
jgi:hypothetical protein